MQFHVANTFLQTFLLVAVGALTLFFAIDNFTDRIMVTLTTLLVIATVTASIQAVRTLPKFIAMHTSTPQQGIAKVTWTYLNVMLRRIYRRPTTTNSSITGCCSRSSPSFSFAAFTPMSAICVAKRPKSPCRSSSVVGIGKGAHFLLRYYRIHLHLSLASHDRSAESGPVIKVGSRQIYPRSEPYAVEREADVDADYRHIERAEKRRFAIPLLNFLLYHS